MQLSVDTCWRPARRANAQVGNSLGSPADVWHVIAYISAILYISLLLLFVRL